MRQETGELRSEIGTVNQRIDEFNRSLNQRIDETNNSLGQRIDESNRSLNERIDDLNRSLGQRIDSRFALLVTIMIAMTGVIIAAIKI